MSRLPSPREAHPAPTPRRRGPGRRLALALLLLLLLGALAAWALFNTGVGRDLALARVQALLPAGSLTWESVHGTLAGPLRVSGLSYDVEGTRVRAGDLMIDLDAAALLAARVEVRTLVIADVEIELPAAPEREHDDPWPREFAPFPRPPTLDLPLGLGVRELRLERVEIGRDGERLSLIQHASMHGELVDGRLRLEDIEVESDRGRLGANIELDSLAHWDIRAQVNAEVEVDGRRQPVQLSLSGDLSELRMQVDALETPGVSLRLDLLQVTQAPRWSLRMQAPQLDPAELGIEAPRLAIQLEADGNFAQADLQGQVTVDSHVIRIEPSTLQYAEGRLSLAPLQLQVQGGRIEATGDVELGAQPARGTVALRWSDLLLHAEAEPAVRSEGRAWIEGDLEAYSVRVDGRLLQHQRITGVELSGRGDHTHLAVDSLLISDAQGRLQAEGVIAWAEQPEWRVRASLQDFDPAPLLPGFPGAVDAELRSEGRWQTDGPSGQLRLDPIGGTLRGLDLGGHVAVEAPVAGTAQGVADLRLGESRIEAQLSWSDTLSLDLALAPLELEAILPDAAGQLTGAVRVRGAAGRPDVRADLELRELRGDGLALDAATLRADVRAGARGEFSLRGQGLVVGAVALGAIQARATGDREDHRLRIELDGEQASLILAVNGGEREGRWLGEVGTLEVTPTGRAAWALDGNPGLALDPAQSTMRLDATCLRSSESALCARADLRRGEGTLRVDLEALPLAALNPWLETGAGSPRTAWGDVSGQLVANRGAAGEVTGELRLNSTRGGLRLEPQSPRDWLFYRDLAFEARLRSDRLEAGLTAELGERGELEARLVSTDPMQSQGALEGSVRARIADLAFLELLSGDIAAPKGVLRADLALAGTRAEPRVSGDLQLADFAAELPGLGLALKDGELRLEGDGAQRATLRGSVASGNGRLVVEGRLDASADAQALLRLSLRGSDLLAADLPELQATVSPDLEVELRDNLLRLRGEVVVPRARIDLERLQTRTTASPDAVVVDAGASQQAGLQLDSELRMRLGDEVRLNGFGLAGSLTGGITVRDRPGRPTLARGTIEVGGAYKAYGQDLSITRGRLAYASSPLDNPALDVRAQREIDDVTVGVQVRGSAMAPELTLWSEPALAQAEQLSYLVLGRPLRSASQADGAQLSQAAAAIGGNLLAKKLGARMGLDEVGVADSRALGGAALTVGKYLSPKLYVSYGVALFGPGQVVTFKYLLSRVWSVQIDSGTENRAALNYRLER